MTDEHVTSAVESHLHTLRMISLKEEVVEVIEADEGYTIILKEAKG